MKGAHVLRIPSVSRRHLIALECARLKRAVGNPARGSSHRQLAAPHRNSVMAFFWMLPWLGFLVWIFAKY